MAAIPEIPAASITISLIRHTCKELRMAFVSDAGKFKLSATSPTSAQAETFMTGPRSYGYILRMNDLVILGIVLKTAEKKVFR